MGLGVTTLAVVVLVVAAWASFWGALGANLAMSRGGPLGIGLRWGLLLGPFGLGITMARTRGGGRGVDGRVTAGKQIAGRYSTKARASVDAWREAGSGSPVGSPVGSPEAAAPLSDPSRHEPPSWVPDVAAVPAPRAGADGLGPGAPLGPPVAPVWGAQAAPAPNAPAPHPMGFEEPTGTPNASTPNPGPVDARHRDPGGSGSPGRAF